uniref:Uncharacterized protein n=1 Tax=Calidris pygmaea TaxID=425635 RepID=A0A8C3JGR6_9CHAR
TASNALLLCSSVLLVKYRAKGEKFRAGLEQEESLCFPHPPPVTAWKQMEEIFVISSVGEGTEVIDMVQHDDSQRLRNSAVKDLQLDVALSLNTCSIVLFFLCVT